MFSCIFKRWLFYYYQTLYNQMFSRSSATQAAGAKKESIKKTSRCCITGTSSLAKHSAVRQRSCLFTKPHNCSRLASPWGGCWWRQVSAGVMAAGGGAAHAAGQISSTEEDRGKWGRGRWRHCKGLEVDLLRPTRCGPSEDVLNLLSAFVLRPRQGGWKWGEGWRGGHKSAPFRLKTGFKSHFKDTSSLNQKRSKLKKKKWDEFFPMSLASNT